MTGVKPVPREVTFNLSAGFPPLPATVAVSAAGFPSRRDSSGAGFRAEKFKEAGGCFNNHAPSNPFREVAHVPRDQNGRSGGCHLEKREIGRIGQRCGEGDRPYPHRDDSQERQNLPRRPLHGGKLRIKKHHFVLFQDAAIDARNQEIVPNHFKDSVTNPSGSQHAGDEDVRVEYDSHRAVRRLVAFRASRTTASTSSADIPDRPDSFDMA